MPRFKFGFPWTLGESIESVFETLFSYLMLSIILIGAGITCFCFWIIYMIYAGIMYVWIEIDSFFYKVKEDNSIKKNL